MVNLGILHLERILYQLPYEAVDQEGDFAAGHFPNILHLCIFENPDTGGCGEASLPPPEAVWGLDLICMMHQERNISRKYCMRPHTSRHK